MQRLQTMGWSTFIRWVGLLLLSSALVVVLERMRLPAALLLGSMLGAIVFAAAEKTVVIPPLATAIAQALVGCLVANAIPASILAEIGRDWPIFVCGVLSVMAAAVALGYVLARFQVLPGTTAIWGSMPGGASVMSIMAESFGADMRLVAFMQYLRVVCVAIAASTISKLWVDTSGAALPTVIWFPPVDILPAIETTALIAISIVLTRRFRIQAGVFLLPMIVGIVLQNAGLMRIELPPWLLALAYAFVGWTIGIRFTRRILGHAARALPQVIGSTLTLIAICCVFAAALVYFAGIDPLTAYLATSPGGADSVAIIATSTHVDVPFIMSMQLARMFFILLTGPKLAQLVVRWAKLSDAPREAGLRPVTPPSVLTDISPSRGEIGKRLAPQPVQAVEIGVDGQRESITPLEGEMPVRVEKNVQDNQREN
jgi:membrane AbrB-like protein